MKQELQDKLFKKYPKIFAEKDLPITQSLIPFGLECGDGWYWLIDQLCSSLQWKIDNPPWENGKLMEVNQVVASQVKEKFGGLRFYTNGTTPEQHAMIELAESMSSHICETCGSTKDIGWTRGWISTMCKECATKGNFLGKWKPETEENE